MAYDEVLADRMRDALSGRHHISEKRMMGGICFFVNGNRICGADRSKAGERRFMVRVGKGNDEAADLPGGAPMFMGDRPMPGFYFVDGDHCDDALLARWVDVAFRFAQSLPAK